MLNLSSYLEKFKNLKSSNSEKETIKKILLEEAGLAFSNEEVVLLDDEIRIKTSQIQKNIIFLKKEVLLKKIKELLPDSNFKNIV